MKEAYLSQRLCYFEVFVTAESFLSRSKAILTI